MNPKIQMTGRLIAAGRTLAGISQEDFASFVGLPVETLCQMEAKGSAWIDSQEDAERISQGLDQIGVSSPHRTGSGPCIERGRRTTHPSCARPWRAAYSHWMWR